MTLRNKTQHDSYKEFEKHAAEDLTVREIWEKTGKLGSLASAYHVIKSNEMPHKQAKVGRRFKDLAQSKQPDACEEYAKHADEKLTVNEIWERTGKLGSLSHAYHVLRTNSLPYKRSTPGRKFKLLSEPKYLNELKQLDTPNLTIKQIMGKLGLTKTSEYYTVLKTLNAAGMPYKRAKYLKKQSKHEAQLRGIDTANKTIKEIAVEMGFSHEWQIRKLYALMDKLGLTYKKAK